MNRQNLSYGIPGNCNDEGGCGNALCFSCYPDASINQKIHMKKITLSILTLTSIALAAAPALAGVPSTPQGCRNVNDDVKECVDKRQGPQRTSGYLTALKTMPPEMPEGKGKGQKGDRFYRGSGRFTVG